MNLVLKVADVFTITPGARYPSEGLFSGEEFRQKHLLPAFNRAVEGGVKLTVDLDGTVGYGTSFLEEAFGGLAREFSKAKVKSLIEFISLEEPYLVDDIKEYIDEA